MMMSQSKEALAMLRALGVDPERVTRVVVTFEAGEPVLVEQYGTMRDGATFSGRYVLIPAKD
jgi:hypothetical protein